MNLERRQSREIPHTAHFDVDLRELTRRERQVSDVLYNAAFDMAPIYARQENNNFPGANFYPHDATPQEIEEANRDNRDILSEYTVVKRNPQGKLVPTPYHIEYESLLESPAQKLRHAAEMSPDLEFGKYLSLRAESLTDGDFEKSEHVWLSMPHEPTLDIAIGFYDRYIDKLFSRKYAALAWSGVVDRQKTEEAQDFVDAFLQEYGWKGSPIRARVDKTRLFAGLAANNWSANNLPCQQDWREKYGNKITIFEPSFRRHFQNRISTLHAIWPNSERKSTEILEKASRFFLFGHEASHPIIRRLGDENRLKSHYSTVSELYCDILSIDVAKKLVGKKLTEAEWELLFPSLMAIGTNRFKELQDPSAFSDYLKGESIALNYLLDHGGIDVINGTLKIQSSGRFKDSLSELHKELEGFMIHGSEQDADEFIRAFGRTETFQRFVT